MNDDNGIHNESAIGASTAFERWELPALLEQEEIDVEAQRVEELPTLEEIEKIRADAYEEGYKAGKEQGVNDGLKDGQKLIQKKISALVDSFNKPFQQQDERLEKVLLDMTLQLTQAIIRRELSVDSGSVQKIILEVFNSIDEDEGKFRIQLNPLDMKGVAYFLEKEYSGQANYQLISDKQVSQGGCVIRSEAHYVDARIETQINKMLDEVYNQKNTAIDEALEDQPSPAKSFNEGLPEAEKTDSLKGIDKGILSSSEADKAKKADLSSMPFFDSDNSEP